MTSPDRDSMAIGAVQYASVGTSSVAYRVVGDEDADRDLLLLFGGALPMEALFEEESARRFVAGLAAFARVVVFDRRGIGLSDPIGDEDAPLTTVFADDIAAVIEHAHLDRPALLAINLVDPAVVFAAARPDALEAIVMYEPNLTALRDDALRATTIQLLQDNVAGDEDLLALACPTRADDVQFREWFDRAGRTGASPGVARRLYEAPTDEEVAVIQSAYEDLDTRLLVLRRPAATMMSRDTIRAAVPRAQIVDLPGGDWYFLGERMDALHAECSRFLTGAALVPEPGRRVMALLFTDLVASTTRASALGDDRWRAVIAHHDATMRAIVERCGGQVVKYMGDGMLAVLPSTSVALGATLEIRAALALRHLEVRAAVHVGDVEMLDDDISGVSINFAARVLALAEAGVILVSQSARLAALGGPHRFTTYGHHPLKGIEGDHEIFALRDDAPSSQPPG